MLMALTSTHCRRTLTLVRSDAHLLDCLLVLHVFQPIESVDARRACLRVYTSPNARKSESPQTQCTLPRRLLRARPSTPAERSRTVAADAARTPPRHPARSDGLLVLDDNADVPQASAADASARHALSAIIHPRSPFPADPFPLGICVA